MPLAAIIVGAILCDVAFRGSEHDMAKQLGQDFGAGSKFWSWAAAIGILGGIGYVPALRKLSTAALALVVVVLVLHNGGLFQQLSAVVRNPPAPSKPVALSDYSGSSGSSGGGSGGGSGGAMSMLGDFGGGGGGESSMLSEAVPLIMMLA